MRRRVVLATLVLLAAALPTGKLRAEEPAEPAPPQAQVLVPEAETLGIGRALRIKVPGLQAWLGEKSWTELRLFLADRELEGLQPASVAGEDVVFRLDSFDRDQIAWQALLASRDGTEADVPVSVGLKGEKALLFAPPTVKLCLIDQDLAWLAGIGLGVILLALLVLAQKSDLLRDSGPEPATGRKPFSLARCQMAWWTVLVLFGFLFLSLFQGSPATIPTAILGLMGIAAGTFVGARMIPAQGETPPALPPSEGLLLDILTEPEGGISLHRFQIAVWTLALGITFVVMLWTRLQMPELGGNLIGLMGISNAAYLGFKFTEGSK